MKPAVLRALILGFYVFMLSHGALAQTMSGSVVRDYDADGVRDGCDRSVDPVPVELLQFSID